MAKKISISIGFILLFAVIIFAQNNIDWKKIEQLNTKASQEIGKQDWSALIITAEEILKINPDYEWGYYFNGLGLTHSGKLLDGEKQLKKSLLINPQNFWANYILFYNYFQQKNLSAEVQANIVRQLLSENIIKSNPQDIISFYILYSEILQQNNKEVEAGKQLEQALLYFPKEPRIRGYYAVTFFRKDQSKWLKNAKDAFDLIPVNERNAKNKYQFPLKGQNIKVLQGNNGNISHQGPFVAYDWDFVFVDKSGKYADKFDEKEGHYIFDQPVYAAADGTVVEAYDLSPDTEPMKNKPNFEPNHIYILHSENETSKYIHLKKSSILVHVGDAVKKGQMIARVGSSGSYADIPHLHFGIRRGFFTVQAKLYGIAIFKNESWIGNQVYVPLEGDILKSEY